MTKQTEKLEKYCVSLKYKKREGKIVEYTMWRNKELEKTLLQNPPPN